MYPTKNPKTRKMIRFVQRIIEENLIIGIRLFVGKYMIRDATGPWGCWNGRRMMALTTVVTSRTLSTTKCSVFCERHWSL